MIATVGQSVNTNVRLEAISCCQCGTVFAIDFTLMRTLRETGQSFYCPNGHKVFFGEGENDRLRKELHRAEKERSAAKSNLTRLKNRVASGVCPCCKRYFGNLHRHMAHQHPDFNKEEKEEAEQETTEGVTMESFKDWLSAEQAAEKKGCHYITIVNALKAGRVSGHFDGHRWYVDPKSLETFRLYQRG